MPGIQKLVGKIKNLHPCSKLAIKIGFFLMICFYIIAIVALYLAPTVPNYFYAMAAYRGSMEAAPACLVVGICAGLLGDLMLSGGKKDRNEEDK